MRWKCALIPKWEICPYEQYALYWEEVQNLRISGEM